VAYYVARLLQVRHLVPECTLPHPPQTPIYKSTHSNCALCPSWLIRFTHCWLCLHPPKTPIYKSTHSNCALCPSWLIRFTHCWLCLQLALVFTVGWNINTSLQSEHSLLTRKAVSGILYPYNSDKTNAQKSEISIKINVYIYRRTRRHASCSVGVLCRCCGVVTSNAQQSVYKKHTSRAPSIAGILYSSHIIALDLFCCHCRRRSYFTGIRFLKLCQSHRRN